MAVAAGAVVPAIAVAGRSESERLGRRELDVSATLDLGAESIQPAVLDGVFEPRVLTVFPIAPVALHGDHRFGDRQHVLGFAETYDIGDAWISVALAVGHAHAATDGHVPALDLFLVEDRDEAEIVGQHVDVVRRRHRHHDLKLTRQVGLAVDRFGNFLLTSGDALAFEPDLAIGRGAWQEMVGDEALWVLRGGMRSRLIRIGIANYFAIDVAAGRDRV